MGDTQRIRWGLGFDSDSRLLAESFPKSRDLIVPSLQSGLSVFV